MLNLFSLPSASLGAEIRTYEGYGVKRCGIACNQSGYSISGIPIRSSSAWITIEFPILGHSLPCVFTIDGAPSTNGVVTIGVFEYGGIPDADYFDIVDLDEDGMPIYESGSVRYKKPLAEDGKSFKERVIIPSEKKAKATKARKEK